MFLQKPQKGGFYYEEKIVRTVFAYFHFSIYHNGVNIWDAGSRIVNPHGTILDDLIIDAVVGDTITVLATLWGTVWDDDFTGNYANVSFHAAVEIEPVPIPGAIWLLGSGLITLVGIRRRG